MGSQQAAVSRANEQLPHVLIQSIKYCNLARRHGGAALYTTQEATRMRDEAP